MNIKNSVRKTKTNKLNLITVCFLFCLEAICFLNNILCEANYLTYVLNKKTLEIWIFLEEALSSLVH